MAKKPEVKLEATPETWSPDEQARAALELGRLRGHIDRLKCAVDRIHRARKCPDTILLEQKAQILADAAEADSALVDLGALLVKL